MLVFMLQCAIQNDTGYYKVEGRHGRRSINMGRRGGVWGDGRVADWERDEKMGKGRERESERVRGEGRGEKEGDGEERKKGKERGSGGRRRGGGGREE